MSERGMVRPSEPLAVRFGTFDFQGYARISTGASGPTPQTWKLPFAKSIASMPISVIDAPSAWFL